MIVASTTGLMVHRYWEVSGAGICREAREGGVDIVEKFAEEIKGYVSRARGSWEV